VRAVLTGLCCGSFMLAAHPRRKVSPGKSRARRALKAGLLAEKAASHAPRPSPTELVYPARAARSAPFRVAVLASWQTFGILETPCLSIARACETATLGRSSNPP